MRRLIYSLALGVALVIPALLAACGGTSAATPNTVNVTLSDYKIAASQTTFTVGTRYHFVVKNEGKSSHELMLMPPVSGDMGMGNSGNMGHMDHDALFHIDASQLPAGATRTYDYTFTQAASKGSLEFACHVGDHYQMGMKEPITVVKA